MGLCLLSGTFSLLCWLLSHDTESSENLLQFAARDTVKQWKPLLQFTSGYGLTLV